MRCANVEESSKSNEYRDDLMLDVSLCDLLEESVEV